MSAKPKKTPPPSAAELRARAPRELTDLDYAELALEDIGIPDPDSEALAEALNYLDLAGHTDAAVRLANAVNELRAAIQHAYHVLNEANA